jgi:hypothetical protein
MTVDWSRSRLAKTLRTPLARPRTAAVLFAEGRQPWEPSALAVRLVIGLSGLAVMWIPAHHKPVLLLATAVGVGIAASSPARGGAAFAVIAGIGGWFASYGEHGAPPIARVLAFGCALYLLHSSAALAGAVSIRSKLDRVTALRWTRRGLLHLAIAGALAALSYAALAGLHDYASFAVELVGLIGAVGVLAAVAWLFSRSLR